MTSIANLNIGALLRQEQSYEEARSYLVKALTLRPGDPAVRYQLGALDLATGQTENARKGLEELIGQEPSFSRPRNAGNGLLSVEAEIGWRSGASDRPEIERGDSGAAARSRIRSARIRLQ